MEKQIFHRCKCLMPDDEETADKKETLGIKSDSDWVRHSFRYDDVRVFYDWVNENEEVLGTTIITMMGERFDIDTDFEVFSKLISENLSINGWVTELN